MGLQSEDKSTVMGGDARGLSVFDIDTVDDAEADEADFGVGAADHKGSSGSSKSSSRDYCPFKNKPVAQPPNGTFKACVSMDSKD